MSNRRIIYYYQTFSGLTSILKQDTPVTHIHLSAIHFGNNPDGSPYIHLNNYPPDDKRFDSVWNEITIAHNLGIKIVLMMGGSGSAFTDLFNNFDVYYSLLVETIKNHNVIGGIDLDVEEEAALDNIKMLIDRLNTDFGQDFIISMAPVQSSLQQDYPGMGGFVYKNLYNSPQGQRINYFNGQFYGDYSTNAYVQAINNGYPADKVVMGAIYGQDFTNCLDTVTQLANKYEKFGGVFMWEYFMAPPGAPANPGLWAYKMKNVLNKIDKNILNMLYNYIYGFN